MNKVKREISLSHKAVAIVNRILSEGKRVQIDFDQRTDELRIQEVQRGTTVYKVVIPPKGERW